MKKVLCVALALVMLVAFGACGKKAETSSVIRIGVITPLTGDVAVYGQSVRDAAQMAFDEINAAGGAGGKTFSLEFIDDKGDPTEAVAAYNRLRDGGVDFIFGAVTSKPSLAVAELAGADGIPMLTATSSHPDITKYGQNIFRVCYLDPFQGTIQARFCKDTLGASKVGVLYNTSDDYSEGIAKVFVATAESLGLTVVGQEGYATADTDFKTQLTSLQAAGAEAIALPDYYNRTALVASQCAEMGFNVPIVGPDGVDGVFDVIEQANIAVLNSVYFTNHYFVGDPNEKIQNFVKNYETKYGAKPNALGALGYDGAYVIAEAFKATNGDVDHAKVVAALKNMDYQGVTGRVFYDVAGQKANFDAGKSEFEFLGDPSKSVSIIHILDGAYELAATVNP